MATLVEGSIGIDDIKTPRAKRKRLLGGSASYAAVAASFFTEVNLLGVAGEDFPQEHIDLFTERNINLDNLEIISGGKTFRWSGEYFEDINQRETLHVELNVLGEFEPKLNERAQASHVLLLANDSPETHLKVIEQCQNPDFILADTMDLWITTMREQLEAVCRRVDLLVLNDSEAKQFSERSNLVQAGEVLLGLGPKYVVIKKGEHGALLFSQEDFFSCSAYPLREVHDPTGAGDCFIGGVAGFLDAQLQSGQPITFDVMDDALVQGTILASFNCESFSMQRLQGLKEREIQQRCREFKEFTQF